MDISSDIYEYLADYSPIDSAFILLIEKIIRRNKLNFIRIMHEAFGIIGI